jgi:hypothetical protein
MQCGISFVKNNIPDYLHLKLGSAEFFNRSSTSLSEFLSKAYIKRLTPSRSVELAYVNILLLTRDPEL